MALRLRQVAPRQGLRWVALGLGVFVKRPLGLTALLVGFFFTSLALSVLLPVIGSVLSLMALPLLSLGFMSATHGVLQGQPPQALQWIAPLRTPGPRRMALLKLCALYGAVLMAMLLVSGWVMGDAVERLGEAYGSAGPQSDEAQAALSDPRLADGLLLQAVLIALLSVPFWHAPPLIGWAGQSVAQSLFSSWLACWRAKGAFALYGLAWAGLLLLTGVVVSAVAALLISLGAGLLVPFVLMSCSLMFMSAFYSTLYFSFVDSFATSPDALAA